MVTVARVRRLLVIALSVSTLSAHGGTIDRSNSKPPISVADMVRYAVIGDPMSPTWNDSAAKVSLTSPNGERVAVVVRYGNPEQVTNEAELLIYRTSTLTDGPLPQVVARFASTTNYQPIALVHWLSDSQKLVFAGTQGNQLPQIYRADVQTGEIKQLTDLHSPLQWYDITASGEWLATLSRPTVTTPSEDCLQRGCLVSAETLSAAQNGESEMAAPIELHDLRKGSSQVFLPPEASDADLVRCYDELKGGISPDGRFGLRFCRLRRYHWPSWWADYKTHPDLKTLLMGGNNGYMRQWILYDFERHTSTRLSSAPYLTEQYSRSTPLWIDGGRRVILAGALEPLSNVDAHERDRRAAHYAILVINPATRHTERIAQLDSRVLRITEASWDQQNETLRVESVDSAEKLLPSKVYRRAGGKWTEVPMPFASITGHAASILPSVILEQSLNKSPVLLALNPQTGVTKTILDPNPWLSERSLGRVEAISWKSKDGRQWSGGLYYPVAYTPGVRYPVVLQTHGFTEDIFSLYGIARNFAAQPLAGLGVLVLQIAENTEGTRGVQEWLTVRAGYEAAIDHLDRSGLIDRTRVGIQGWSRTGPYMGYTLTQSSYKFAAGVFTITADFGWWWYLLHGGHYGETEYGVSPFGNGLDVWQKMSPSFNLDRVRTPMLMCGDGLAELWDWYAGLRRLGRPVEYWSLPDPAHDIFKVGQRMMVNQLVVDWFRFWLKDEEDPDPAKVTQYMRWRNLRQQQGLAVTSP